MKYTIEEVNISEIRAGDTVVHNGEIKTVCGNSLGNDPFMGVSLFGDSYHSGRKKVEKLTITHATPYEVLNIIK